MLNLNPLMQYISAILLVGGGVIGYSSFESSKTRYEMERFIEQKMDSIPNQTAAILMPKLKEEIKATMIEAGLVDYELIFRNDSLVAAKNYNKLQRSAKALAKQAVEIEIESEKAKIYNEIISITIGKSTLLLEWKYNPKIERWELKEIK